MKLRQHWFQLAVIAILLMIWLEVGGDETVSRIYRRSVSAMAAIGGSKQEEPAPWKPGQQGGMPFDNSAQIQTMADLAAAQDKQAATARATRELPAPSAQGGNWLMELDPAGSAAQAERIQANTRNAPLKP